MELERVDSSPSPAASSTPTELPKVPVLTDLGPPTAGKISDSTELLFQSQRILSRCGTACDGSESETEGHLSRISSQTLLKVSNESNNNAIRLQPSPFSIQSSESIQFPIGATQATTTLIFQSEDDEPPPSKMERVDSPTSH